jgi:hypothetical protein
MLTKSVLIQSLDLIGSGLGKRRVNATTMAIAAPQATTIAMWHCGEQRLASHTMTQQRNDRLSGV